MKNVPMDDTYTDTRWFTSAGEQNAYFMGKAVFTAEAHSYQRVNSSVAQPRIAYSIRVKKIADDLYGCNYLAFQNTNFANKWYYCFIKMSNYLFLFYK